MNRLLLSLAVLLLTLPRAEAQVSCPLEAESSSQPSLFVGPSETVTVPVFFHVITSANGDGFVSDQRIADQIAVINAAFSNGPAAYNTYEFELIGISRTQSQSWYEGLTYAAISGPTSTEAREALVVDPARVLNIYTAGFPGGGPSAGDVRGFATFPFSFEYPGGLIIDTEDSIYHGVVMKPEYISGGGGSAGFEEDLVVHEIGHYLGLFHTFNSTEVGFDCNRDCGLFGDRVCDTFPHPAPSTGCSGSTNACGDPIPSNNYMNVVTDACATEFTDGQHARMSAETETGRPSLGAGPPVFQRVASGVSVTLEPGTEWATTDVEVEAGASLTVQPGGLWRFDPGAQLEVRGYLTAEGTLFTASDASQGWGGLRVEGAPTAFDGVTIEGVSAASGAGAALTYIDSEPNIRESFILNSIGSGVDGIYLGGAAQVGTIEDVFIQDVSGNGIGLSGEFDQLRFIGNTLLDNGGHGFAFGYRSAGFLGDNTSEGNGGQGLYAYDASVYLDEAYNGPSGLNELALNDAGGVLARAGAVVRGGTATAYKDNSLVENGQPGAQWYDTDGTKEGPDAWVRDAGTVAYLQNDWWGRPANPDTTTCAGSRCRRYTGTLFVDPMRSTDTGGGSFAKGATTDSPNASSFTAPGDGTQPSTRTAQARTALLATSDVAEHGRRHEALALLQGVVAAGWGTPTGAVAISETGRLVSEEVRWAAEDVSAEALTSIEAWAAVGSPHRARALAVLARTRAAVGDRTGALAAAETLAVEPDSAAALEGHVALFYLHLAIGRREGYAKAADALRALKRVAPGSEEAARAWHVLTIEAGSEVAGLAPVVGEPTAEAMTKATAAAKSSGSASRVEETRLAIWPNPGSGVATVTIGLPEDVQADVVVYDARGRRVAVLHGGPLEAGEHRLSVEVAALPAGTYLVRARLGEAVLTQTLTVLR